MGYYALFYEAVDDFIARRTPYREEHLRLAREAQERGELAMAGALGEPANAALLVFQGSDARGAEEFARRDPYVTNGLVKNWKVRPWTVVVGGEGAEGLRGARAAEGRR